jgi:hypothetical protein
MRPAYQILQKPRHRWLLGLLCWLSSGGAWAQGGPVIFPQMAAVTQFKTVGSARYHRGDFSPLEITRQQIQLNGKSYTAFVEQRGKKRSEGAPLPFILRLAGDSLLMPLAIENYVPATRKAYLLDSLGSERLENTFFRFGAAVGTKWTCLASYGFASKWNTVTTELREVRQTAAGELLYVLAFSEAIYGVSDSEFWRELVISRERGLVQLTGEGMVGGRQVYKLAEKSARPNSR